MVLVQSMTHVDILQRIFIQLQKIVENIYTILFEGLIHVWFISFIHNSIEVLIIFEC